MEVYVLFARLCYIFRVTRAYEQIDHIEEIKLFFLFWIWVSKEATDIEPDFICSIGFPRNNFLFLKIVMEEFSNVLVANIESGFRLTHGFLG